MARAFQDLTQPPLVQLAHPVGVEGTGPLPLLHICTAVLFQDDAIDTLAQEKIAECQSGYSASHDDDGGVLARFGHVFLNSLQNAGPHAPERERPCRPDDGAARCIPHWTRQAASPTGE